MILHGIFPTPVAKFSLGRDFTSEEIEFISSLQMHRNQGNSTTDNGYVLKNPCMVNLTSFIQLSLDEYIKIIHSPKEETSLRITQSWVNITKRGEFHHKHNHPNSFISGVLYVKADKEKDLLYFYSNAYRPIKIITENWNAYNSDVWRFEVETGDMFLFPSSLAHMVETVQSDERISLSFNTFPTGLVGDENEKTGLRL